MAKVKFAFTPHAMQQDIINHVDGIEKNSDGNPYQFFVVACGRQWGKSWLAKYTLLNEAINKGHRCMWVAPSIPNARGHWDELVSLVERSGIPTRRVSQSAKQIVFADGGQISVRPAIEPDNMRGETLDYMVLDEAAFFRNGEYVWYSVCVPMVSASRGRVLFTTTPNGRNWLYTLFNKGNDPKDQFYKSWHAPSISSPYQDPVLLKELRKTMPELQWREEFMAEFLADGSGIFSGAEKASVVVPLQAPIAGHTYVAGIDFGFNHDATVFTVADKYTRQQVFGNAFYGFGTVGTLGRLKSYIEHWQPEVTHLEKNGIGETLFDMLKAVLSGDAEINTIIDQAQTEETGHYVPSERTYRTSWGGRIRAIHMDNATKRAMVERLSADIEYGRLSLLEAPPGSYGERQLNEMSTYLRERTQSGFELTYNAAEGSHDDTISALYLAYHGVPKPAKFQLEPRSTEKRVNPFKHGSKLRTHRRGTNNAKRY